MCRSPSSPPLRGWYALFVCVCGESWTRPRTPCSWRQQCLAHRATPRTPSLSSLTAACPLPPRPCSKELLRQINCRWYLSNDQPPLVSPRVPCPLVHYFRRLPIQAHAHARTHHSLSLAHTHTHSLPLCRSPSPPPLDGCCCSCFCQASALLHPCPATPHTHAHALSRTHAHSLCVTHPLCRCPSSPPPRGGCCCSCFRHRICVIPARATCSLSHTPPSWGRLRLFD